MALTERQIGVLKNRFSHKGLTLDRGTMEKIASYGELLRSWSRRMNLISKKDLELWVERHFLDSLAPLESIPESGSLIDVGSGAGFPGIPLAIVRSHLQIILMESTHKKVLFLRAVKRALSLENVNIVEGRLEETKPTSMYDVITIRALPGWQKMIDRLKSFLGPKGIIIRYVKRGTWYIIKN